MSKRVFIARCKTESKLVMCPYKPTYYEKSDTFYPHFYNSTFNLKPTDFPELLPGESMEYEIISKKELDELKKKAFIN